MTDAGVADVPRAAFVDGEWQPVSESYAVNDPATGALVGNAPRATTDDVDRAVAAARRAFPDWSQTPLAERCAVLARLAKAVDEHRDALGDLVIAETGALAGFARDVKVGFMVARLAWHASAEPSWLADTLKVPTADGSQRETVVMRQPAGVVACITPYNFQLPNVAAKVGAALVAGCTVVLKPAPQDPLAVLRFCEIIEDLDVPAGVINLITSDASDVSQALVRHSDVDMVSFTGSTAVGLSIAADAAGQLKRLLLELGGKSALIVTEDADIELAARAAASTWTVFSGQICTAPTRVIVHEAVKSKLIAQLEALAGTLRVGDPRDSETDLGPLITPAHRARVEGYIAKGVEEGAHLLVDGRAGTLPPRGSFVGPTLFVDVDPSMVIAREEIFGPVVSVLSATSDDDAIRLANDSPYGLDGYVWAGSVERASTIAARLRTGHVSVNGAPVNPEAPFGGFRQSGVGRDRGIAGVHAYTEMQSIDLPA